VPAYHSSRGGNSSPQRGQYRIGARDSWPSLSNVISRPQLLHASFGIVVLSGRPHSHDLWL